MLVASDVNYGLLAFATAILPTGIALFVYVNLPQWRAFDRLTKQEMSMTRRIEEWARPHRRRVFQILVVWWLLVGVVFLVQLNF